jgi:uncharacterized protein (TIGR02147 family)
MSVIYEYLDYRRFLKDRFSALKKDNSQFSYRYFNRRAGIASSGFLKLVMDGKRNLADEGIGKVALGLKLGEKEKKYFRLLVKFNQATSHAEKEDYFQSLCKNKHFLKAKPLAGIQYQIFSHWYSVAILELVRFETNQKKDLVWLLHHLRPSVGIREVKRAVHELMSLGLISRSRQGSYERKEPVLKTEDQVSHLLVTNYHQQMSEQASQAVLHDDAKHREFSALTIALSREQFDLVKGELQTFREHLHSLLEKKSDAPKSLVAQINLQLFQLASSANQS